MLADEDEDDLFKDLIQQPGAIMDRRDRLTELLDDHVETNRGTMLVL